MKGKKIVSTLLVLLLLASLPVSAHAAVWDIGKGNITVNAGSGGQTVTQGSQVDIPDSAPVITGSSTENTVTINAEKDQTSSVTLSGANIDVSNEGKAAVSTNGEGNVSIELDGENTLKSGYRHAGLEKNNGGGLTIADQDENGKLTATGGSDGAGIGGFRTAAMVPPASSPAVRSMPQATAAARASAAAEEEMAATSLFRALRS